MNVMILIVIGVLFISYVTVTKYLNRVITKKIATINTLIEDTTTVTLDIIHPEVSNSVRNMLINQFNVIKNDITCTKYNILNISKLNYHIDTIKKTKDSIISDIAKINTASSFILNEKNFISNLNKLFNDSKRELKTLYKKYDKQLIDRHLKNFTSDKGYYTDNFISVISKYFKNANNSLIKLNISDALYNIEKINDLSKVYYFEISSVSELAERLSISYNNFNMYDDEIKPIRGSLYNKITSKIHKLRNRNSDIVELWNDIIKNIDIYYALEDNDYIAKSNRLILIISELMKIDMLLDAELEIEMETQLLATA